MRKNEKKKFLELFNELPSRIQDFLASDKMGMIIEDSLNLSKISSEKFSEVMDTVTKVLTLQLPKNQFRNELEKITDISPVAAQIINKIIEEKIFRIFKKEIAQYKPKPLIKRTPQKEEIKKSINLVPPKKIEGTQKKEIKQMAEEQIPLGSVIPEYSFPEPSKVKVEKPVSKIEELKRVVVPKVSSEQQEKIREKLLAAMQKKDIQPEIVEKMKKVSFKKPAPEEKKEPLKKKPIGEVRSSEVLGGEGKKFQDEEVFKKTEKEKPYILDVKLKEKEEGEKEKSTVQEPIPYKKYQKKNPFGEA
jgi:hypothetical protein